MGTETEQFSGWSEFTGYQDGSKRLNDYVNKSQDYEFTTAYCHPIVHGVFLKPGYKVEQNRIFAQFYGKRMRTALLVDVHSLYQGCARKYPGQVLDYGLIGGWLGSLGNTYFVKTAYGRQPEASVQAFANVLRRAGYDLEFGPGSKTVNLALEAAQLSICGSIDNLILGTNNAELAPVMVFARRQGIYTSVFGFDIPAVFEPLADLYEVPCEMTQDK